MVAAITTPAIAGPDQDGSSLCGLTVTSLAANVPVTGTGSWSIVAGAGGTVTTPDSPTSEFTGTPGVAYVLRWTISNAPCAGSTDDVNILFREAPTATASQTDILCSGANTGSATAIPAGGSGTYTYLWNTVPVQTSITATGLAAGTYSVTVTDGNGCTATASATITEPLSPLSGTISSQINVPVPGGNTGSVTVTGTGGSSPYLYSLNSGAFQASGTFGSLTAGTYTVTVQDINLCTFDVPVTITEPSAVLSGSVESQTNVPCFNTASGSVTIAGAGGVPPYDFSSDGVVFQASGTFGNLVAGIYTFTVRDAGLITADVNVTITEPASSVGASVISQTDVLCAGSSTGEVTIEGSGGTAPYQYRIGTTAYQASGTFSALAAGSYTLSVQDANQCSQDIQVVIAGPLVPLAINIITSTDVSCAGSANGQITVSGSGGEGPYNYSLNGGTYQSSGTFSNLDVDTYTVSVQDANLCSADVSVTISEPGQLSVSGTGTDASCPDVPDGSIDTDNNRWYTAL